MEHELSQIEFKQDPRCTEYNRLDHTPNFTYIGDMKPFALPGQSEHAAGWVYHISRIITLYGVRSTSTRI